MIFGAALNRTCTQKDARSSKQDAAATSMWRSVEETLEIHSVITSQSCCVLRRAAAKALSVAALIGSSTRRMRCASPPAAAACAMIGKPIRCASMTASSGPATGPSLSWNDRRRLHHHHVARTWSLAHRLHRLRARTDQREAMLRRRASSWFSDKIHNEGGRAPRHRSRGARGSYRSPSSSQRRSSPPSASPRPHSARAPAAIGSENTATVSRLGGRTTGPHDSQGDLTAIRHQHFLDRARHNGMFPCFLAASSGACSPARQKCRQPTQIFWPDHGVDVAELSRFIRVGKLHDNPLRARLYAPPGPQPPRVHDGR